MYESFGKATESWCKDTASQSMQARPRMIHQTIPAAVRSLAGEQNHIAGMFVLDLQPSLPKSGQRLGRLLVALHPQGACVWRLWRR